MNLPNKKAMDKYFLAINQRKLYLTELYYGQSVDMNNVYCSDSVIHSIYDILERSLGLATNAQLKYLKENISTYLSVDKKKLCLA